MVTSIYEPVVYTATGTETPVPLPQGTAYLYDQLNRLVTTEAWQNLDAGTNTWQNTGGTSEIYRNTFIYDANGNITSQLRKDHTGAIIDELEYHYAESGGQVIQNRLYHVNDTYDYNAEDIDDQLNEDGTFAFIDDLELVNVKNNYSYDEIGQLVKDLQEEIETIVWRVDGKIKEIIRVSGSTMDNLQFEYDALGNRIAKHSYDNSNLWLKSTFYVRDAQGNVISVYNKEPDGVNINHEQIEKHIYGSSRLGMEVSVTEMIGTTVPTEEFDFSIGDKQYECSNHLGNVLAVITDKKYARDDNTDLIIDYFQPEVISSQDYSPFGVLLEERNWSSDQYRYAFNGMEKDDEISGAGDHYDFGARMFRSDLGRWLSSDPRAWKYAAWSPYNVAIDNPLVMNDPDGRDPLVTIYTDENGQIVIEVSSAIFVVAETIEDQEEAMKAIGDPDKYYGNSQPVNTNVVIDGEMVQATITFNTEVIMVSGDEDEIRSAREAYGYGVVAYYNPYGDFSFHSEMYGGSISFLPYNEVWQGDFAHELGHDFGLLDLYVEMKFEGEMRHIFLISDDQIVLDLMNDANSPLTNDSYSLLAQGAVDKMFEINGTVEGSFVGPLVDRDAMEKARIGEVLTVGRVQLTEEFQQSGTGYPFELRTDDSGKMTVTREKGNKGKEVKGKSKNVRFL